MGFRAGSERWGEKERKTVNMAVKEKTWDCIHSWLIVGEIDPPPFIYLSWFGILWIIGVIVVFSMIFFHRILENLFLNCVLCQVKCFLKTKMPPTFSMVGIPYPLRKSKPMYQKKQSKPPNFRSSRKGNQNVEKKKHFPCPNSDLLQKNSFFSWKPFFPLTRYALSWITKVPIFNPNQVHSHSQNLFVLASRNNPLNQYSNNLFQYPQIGFPMSKMVLQL